MAWGRRQIPKQLRWQWRDQPERQCWVSVVRVRRVVARHPELTPPMPAPERTPPRQIDYLTCNLLWAADIHETHLPDGSVWYTAQITGELGKQDPATGGTRHIPLGAGSSPHGVIVGPDGAPWVTDSGLNAIVCVDPQTEEIKVFPLPAESGYANLNTVAFDPKGILWFTGQNGIYGRLDPSTGDMQVFKAPRGRGPYGITVTPDGSIYYASLAGSYVGRIDPQTGTATVLEPPTPGFCTFWPLSSSQRSRFWMCP